MSDAAKYHRLVSLLVAEHQVMIDKGLSTRRFWLETICAQAGINLYAEADDCETVSQPVYPLKVCDALQRKYNLLVAEHRTLQAEVEALKVINHQLRQARGS